MKLPFWQRLGLTIAVMLIAGYLSGLLWQSILGFPLPSFAAGVVGGLASLPFWEFINRVRPKK